MFEGRTPREWIATEWSDDLCAELRAERGQSAFLSFFEACTVLAAVALWCQPGQRTTVAVVGDNVAALTVAVSRRGRGDLGRLCRELALVQAHRSLTIAVGHLASELNTWADTLSRLSAPGAAEIPPELLSVPRKAWPGTADLFRICPPEPVAEVDSVPGSSGQDAGATTPAGTSGVRGPPSGFGRYPRRPVDTGIPED